MDKNTRTHTDILYIYIYHTYLHTYLHISYHIISYHIISYHISYHIHSYHIISYCMQSAHPFSSCGMSHDRPRCPNRDDVPSPQWSVWDLCLTGWELQHVAITEWSRQKYVVARDFIWVILDHLVLIDSSCYIECWWFMIIYSCHGS